MPSHSSDSQRLRAGRVSVAIAASLVIIGALRFMTDTLHEFNPEYWRPLAHTPVRYLIRAPSDGTALGDLNAQWFKLLAVPSGLALVWLGYRFGSGTLESKREQFRDPVIRGVWIASFLAGFTLIELDKQIDLFGMGTVMVAGEAGGLNHLIHALGAIAAWFAFGALRFEPLRQAEIDLERELDALEQPEEHDDRT